jgi:hypothetical protein
VAVVSISRQVGSLGEEIALLTAGKLNYTLIDGAEIHRIAQDCDEEFRKECALYESEMIHGFWERFFLNKSANASLLAAINYELAARNNVILLGRGSQIAFQGIPWILKVRIVAPKQIRSERLSDSKGISREETESYIDRYDKERRGLIEQLYKIDASNWDLYDLAINTAALSPDNAADLIVRAVGNMGAITDENEWRSSLSNLSRAKYVECAVRKKVAATAYSSIDASYSSSGVLTLSGYVPDGEAKYKAEEIALAQDEVDRVDNQLIVSGGTF